MDWRDHGDGRPEREHDTAAAADEGRSEQDRPDDDMTSECDQSM